MKVGDRVYIKPYDDFGVITHAIRPTNRNPYDWLVTIDGDATELPYYRSELEVINEDRGSSPSKNRMD